MSVILVTSCSSRKTIPLKERIQASELPRAPLKEVGRIWRAWVKDHYCKLPAGDLYSGRGAIEAKLAAKSANASHWYISAGLGLVSATDEVPGYDLTITGNGPNQIKTKIKDGFHAQAWWHELAKHRRPHRTLARLIKHSDAELIVLALPTNYFKMILDDLCTLNATTLRKTRIIGPPVSTIPQHLRSHWLPYDSRLDGPDSPIPGTRSDFPQRAARHFFDTIWAEYPKGGVQEHVRSVEEYLSRLSYPIIPKRKQVSDREIISLINRLWSRAKGKQARMLRMIRDEEVVACEQSRFKVLFNQVKRERITL